MVIFHSYVKLPEGMFGSWIENLRTSLRRDPIGKRGELQFQSGSPKGRAFVGLKHLKDGGLIIFGFV